jgi:hypothetical protein
MACRGKANPEASGRTFLARGGNGTLTEPQRLLADALDLPMEYAILTSALKDQFPSLPPCYKVDIAEPKSKTTIEVDGKTHRLKRWRFLDARKTAVLNALGWSVLRFSNEEVLRNVQLVVDRVRGHITSKSTSTTTI